MKRVAFVAAALAAAAVAGVTAQAGSAAPDFITPQPAMLQVLTQGRAIPMITVGETIGNYRFEAIPDGIALAQSEQENRLDVWVNHETSLVPFPYVPANPNPSNSQNDFDNAQLSHLVVARSGEVLSGRYVIPSAANYQRFCSNYYAGAAEGFDFPLVLTGEEATDFVNRTGTAWPPGPNAEQAGLAVAYNPQSNQFRSIYGLGRMNHENEVALRGYGHPVILTGDDTFSAPASQLYMYLALNANEVWNDQGHLWAFRSNVPTVNDYGDLTVGGSVAGQFIPVPDAIADGDQTGLENWSNQNNVFQFIRVEDIAQDKNNPNVVYFADTGEPRAIADTAIPPNPPRLRRGPSGTNGPYMNGRIFKMVLNPSDPRVVQSLSVLIDADALGYNNQSAMHQPDNVETTKAGSLLITEDPGSHNQYNPGAGPNSRLWRYNLNTAAFAPVAMVDQSADPAARAGTWEVSGIVDASSFWGPGAYLLDVQAHTIWVETAPGPDLHTASPGPDWLYKREGGQLLGLWLPGT